MDGNDNQRDWKVLESIIMGCGESKTAQFGGNL